MTHFRRFVAALHWLEDAVLMLIFFAMLLLAFAQVGMRNLLDSGWLWADSALRVLVLWLAFWAAAIAARHGHHIRMEIASHYFSPALRRWVAVLADLGCAVISGIVAWYSAVFVWNERSYGEIAFAGIPQWWCEVVIPVTFSLLTIRFLVQAILFARGYQESEQEALTP